MKTTVERAVASAAALKDMGEMKFPIQVSLNIAKNRRVFDEIGREFESRRNDLAKTYGQPNEQNMISIPPDKVQEFTDKERELRNEEIDIDVVQVHVDDLVVDGEPIDIEPNILAPLEWMIDVTPRRSRKRSKR